LNKWFLGVLRLGLLMRAYKEHSVIADYLSQS
jgi:hypothetical protein